MARMTNKRRLPNGSLNRIVRETTVTGGKTCSRALLQWHSIILGKTLQTLQSERDIQNDLPLPNTMRVSCRTQCVGVFCLLVVTASAAYWIFVSSGDDTTVPKLCISH